MSNPTLILASGSKYRATRLLEAGLNVLIHPANIDETAKEKELPKELALRLAKTKANAVAKHYKQGFIIGCDQVAALKDKGSMTILGKPGSEQKAIEQLTLCSGKSVTFYTALSVIDVSSLRMEVAVEPVSVQFGLLSEKQIRRYVQIDKPFDCAGSFKMECAGIFLFESITTRDPNALLGIPLIALKELLASLGYDIFSP